MTEQYILAPEFQMTAGEHELALAALKEHKARKGEEYGVERPNDVEIGENRDSKGRFVRCFEIRGGAFDILVFYNKRENWSQIDWVDERGYDD